MNDTLQKIILNKQKKINTLHVNHREQKQNILLLANLVNELEDVLKSRIPSNDKATTYDIYNKTKDVQLQCGYDKSQYLDKYMQTSSYDIGQNITCLSNNLAQGFEELQQLVEENTCLRASLNDTLQNLHTDDEKHVLLSLEKLYLKPDQFEGFINWIVRLLETIKQLDPEIYSLVIQRVDFENA